MRSPFAMAPSTMVSALILVIALALVLTMAAGGAGAAPASRPAQGPVAGALRAGIARGTGTFDHSAWDRLLASATRDGLVDYRRMQASRAALDLYLDRVAQARLDRLSGPEDEALLINAYNALVVRTILDHPDVASIRDISGVFDGARHRVAGFDLTLDDIEHTLLRPYFQDPRIHFAVNCASRSCAALAPFAYRGDRLDAQLEERTRLFMQDPAHVRLHDGKLELSKYFEWFGADFQPGVVDFVKRYARPDVRAGIEREGRVAVVYMDYDWSLNSVEARDPGAGQGRADRITALMCRWAHACGPAAPLVYALLYAVLVAVFVPAVPLTLAAGAEFGFWTGFVVASLGSTAGAVLAFLLARYLLRGVVERWLSRHSGWSRFDRALEGDSAKVVALARLSPVLPFNLLNYAFGITRVRLVTYALVSWIAMAPATAIFVGAGALAVDVAQGGALGHARTGVLVVGALATLALGWWLLRTLRRGAPAPVAP